MQHIRTGFTDNCGRAWVPVIDSVHELAAHSWEVMQLLEEEESPLLLGDFTEPRSPGTSLSINTSPEQHHGQDKPLSGRIRRTSLQELSLCHTLLLPPGRGRSIALSVICLDIQQVRLSTIVKMYLTRNKPQLRRYFWLIEQLRFVPRQRYYGS